MVWKSLFAGAAFAAVLLAQNQPDIGHVIASDLQAGKFADALELANKALTTRPNDARIWALNGLALEALGRQNDALKAFHQSLQLAANYLPALEGATRIELSRQDCTAARGLLQQIVALRPQNVAAFSQYAACLVQTHHINDAIPAFERLRQMQPQSSEAQYNLAAVLFLAGRYNDVITTLTSARPEQLDAPSLQLLGESYQALGKPEKASTAFREAITRSPSEAQYYADLAYLCLAQRDYQLGIQVASSGIDRAPESAPLYAVRGMLYTGLSDYAKSEADFSRAEQLDPNVAAVSAAHGLADLQRNDVAHAEALIRSRLEHDARDPFLHYLLAETLRRKGAPHGSKEFDEALAAAQEAVERKPDFVLARDVLASLYLEAGNIPAAIDQSRAALRIAPDDEAALYHLILGLRKTGHGDEAAAATKQLLVARRRKQAAAAVAPNGVSPRN